MVQPVEALHLTLPAAPFTGGAQEIGFFEYKDM
jgi:hypothetical protein